MVKLHAESVEINGRGWSQTKAGYPHRPTVFSGATVTFGADSCLDHPEATTAGLSLWLPKAYPDWVPNIGDVVKVKARFADTESGASVFDTVFHGKVDSVKLADNHLPAPAPYVPEELAGIWQEITSKTGWQFSMNNVRVDDQVVIENGNSFRFPETAATTVNSYSIVSPPILVYGSMDHSLQINEYPEDVRVDSGTYTYVHEMNVNKVPTGASTQIDYPSDKGTFSTGPTTQYVYLSARFSTSAKSEGTEAVAFGDIEIKRLFADAPADANAPVAGYRINLQCSDALAEAGRLRLGDTPWTSESAVSRLKRIAELASKHGVQFDDSFDSVQGQDELNGVVVRARDVDSVNALEVYQDTAMSGGLTIGCVENVVRPNDKLLLPSVLDKGTNATWFEWTGAEHASTSVKKVDGAVVRTNLATNPSGETSTTKYGISGGTGSSNVLTVSKLSPRTGTGFIRNSWVVGASTIGGIYYRDGSGVAGDVISGGIWVRWSVPGNATLNVTARDAASTVVASLTTTSVPVVGNQWYWFSFQGLTISANWTYAQLWPRLTTPMPSGSTQDIDGVIIEKASTTDGYFDGSQAGFGGSFVEEVTNVSWSLPVIPVNAIEDDVFEKDTTRVVDQFKLNYFVRKGSLWPDGEFVAVSETGSTLTTVQTAFSPVTRTIKAENQINDPGYVAGAPVPLDAVNGLLVRAKNALSAQATPRWRMSAGLRLVLKNLPYSAALIDLIGEQGRFGQLIRIDGAPELIDRYQRITGGRIVLGDSPSIELDIEPVDYSGPLSLNRNTAYGDPLTRAITLGDLQTITANDLRTVGAR